MGRTSRALESLGVPHAKAMVDVIVLTAVTCCLNSALYTASRMLFLLSTRGDAPSGLSRTAACGTPRAAVLASTAFGFGCVLANYLMPERLFAFLLATSGAVALLVYLVIALSQLRMRAVLERRAAALPLRTWCYPWLMWSVIVVILGVLAVMVWHPAHRMEMLSTATLLAGVLAGTWLNARSRSADGQALAMDDSP